MDWKGSRVAGVTPHHAGRPHIIVLGNEKGGSGKSTTAMHLVVALLHDGFKVGSIDCDARQGSFTRYVDNRKATAASMLVPLIIVAALIEGLVTPYVVQALYNG